MWAKGRCSHCPEHDAERAARALSADAASGRSFNFGPLPTRSRTSGKLPCASAFLSVPPTKESNTFLILAASGSGKSHFVAHGGMAGHLPTVDGDVLIANSVGWPPGSWWLDPAVKAEQDKKVDLAMRSWRGPLSGYPHDAIVLFNSTSRIALDQASCAVVPPTQTIARNARSRTDAGVTNQPSAFNDLMADRERLLTAVTGVMPIFPSFVAAVSYMTLLYVVHHR